MFAIPVLLILALAADPAPADTGATTTERPERLEALAKAGIERVLSRTLDAPVTVGEVRMAREEEGLELHDVSVGNPEGFAKGTAMSADTVRIEADVRSLFSREPEIRLISVSGAAVNAQTQLPQGSNIAKLLKNAKQEKREGPLSGMRQKQWRIQKGVLKEAKVKMDTQLVEKKSTERTLGDIEMSFLGEDGRGMPAQQAVAQFMGRLVKELGIMPAEGPANQVFDLLNGLRGR